MTLNWIIVAAEILTTKWLNVCRFKGVQYAMGVDKYPQMDLLHPYISNVQLATGKELSQCTK